MDRGLVLSGGASKGAFTAGAVYYLIRDKKLEFNIAVGTSTGSLVGGPALLNEASELRNMYVSVTDRDIFANSALGTILNTLGVMPGPVDAKLGPLKELLDDYYIHRHKLDRIIEKKKTLVASCLNIRTGKVVFVSSDWVRDELIDHNCFVRAILASCSEPFFTKPIHVFAGQPDLNLPVPDVRDDDLFYDGGVKEFIPIEHCAVLKAGEVWAISTHPETNEPSAINLANPPSIIDALKWVPGAFGDEIARGDEFRARLYNRWGKVKERIIKRAKAKGLDDQQAKQLVSFDPDDDLLYGLSIDKLHLIRPVEHMPTSLDFQPAIMWDYFGKGYNITKVLDQTGKTEFVNDSLGPWYLPEQG